MGDNIQNFQKTEKKLNMENKPCQSINKLKKWTDSFQKNNYKWPITIFKKCPTSLVIIKLLWDITSLHSKWLLRKEKLLKLKDSPAIMETSMEFFQIIQKTTTIWSSCITSQHSHETPHPTADIPAPLSSFSILFFFCSALSLSWL